MEPYVLQEINKAQLRELVSTVTELDSLVWDFVVPRDEASLVRAVSSRARSRVNGELRWVRADGVHAKA